MFGVHLGQSDASVIDARKHLGVNRIIGLTVETWQQLEQAQDLPIDYIGISSVFTTQTKQDIKTVWGIDKLQQACSYSRIPLVAIGGINVANIQYLRALKLHSVAVTSAITQADCKFTATKQLAALLQ